MFSSLVTIDGGWSEVKLTTMRLNCQTHSRYGEVDTCDELTAGGPNIVLTNHSLDPLQAPLQAQFQRRFSGPLCLLGFIEQLQQHAGPTLARPMQVLDRFA